MSRGRLLVRNGGPCPYTSRGSPLMIRVLRETHETPESVRRRLRLAGGINRYGEPNYRAVWGWSRLTWIGGKSVDLGGRRKIGRAHVWTPVTSASRMPS